MGYWANEKELRDVRAKLVVADEEAPSLEIIDRVIEAWSVEGPLRKRPRVPQACRNCGTSPEACDNLVLESGRPCCSACYMEDTHNASISDWMAWRKEKKESLRYATVYLDESGSCVGAEFGRWEALAQAVLKMYPEAKAFSGNVRPLSEAIKRPSCGGTIIMRVVADIAESPLPVLIITDEKFYEPNAAATFENPNVTVMNIDTCYEALGEIDRTGVHWRHADGSIRTDHMDSRPGDYFGTFSQARYRD